MRPRFHPWRRLRRGGGAALAVLVLATLGAVPVSAQTDDDALALKVKAAFLFNFVKFVTWPPQKFATPSDPILLCVLQPDPFGEILDDTVKDKTVNGRALVIRRAARAADLRDCHLIYLGESDPARLNAGLSQLTGNSILLVHESAEPLANGGIRFLIADRRVRFEVNLAETERESLQLSSKLLGLSSVVRK